MAFGYKFVNLNEDQKHARRVLLEYYPIVAQSSVLVVFALFQLRFFLSWLAKLGSNYERPRSPSFNKKAEGKQTWLTTLQKSSYRLSWWVQKPVFREWGTRAEWIGGGIWTTWLLYLCIVETGDDYLHLTKRFGIIGASQLPLHYLLAVRSPYSPLQLVTRMSHEQLKSAHQVLGRVIFLLLALHAGFYMNFFVLSGFLAKRIKDKDVIFGVISIILFSIISTTALGQMRRWNYRVFYISHVLIANLVVVPLYIHVTHIRPYIYEVVAINVMHLILRARSSKTYYGTIKLLPGTHLVGVWIPLSSMNSALDWKPGQHVYLGQQVGQAPSTSLYDQLMLRLQANPFSVASLPAKDKELVLISKILDGNTKKMAELARSLSLDGSEDDWKTPLALEGPYGASNYFPDFSHYDAILLVAGGIGATFIMPLYRSMLEHSELSRSGGPKVRCVWVVKKLADTQWAFPSTSPGETEPGNAGASDDSTVEVYVTRPVGPDLTVGAPGEAIELAEDEQLLSLEEQMEKASMGRTIRTGRPEVSKIVDEVFSKGDRIAVLTCGPKDLTEKLMESVESWARKGHDVYWHAEAFGWQT